MIYKFTDTKYNYKKSPYYDLYMYYKEGGVYNQNASNHKYTCTWDNGDSKTFTRLDYELLRTGYKKVMGWVFNFKPLWNKYLVNVKYYGWMEFYAPSKMAIRDVIGNNKIVGKIIQL